MANPCKGDRWLAGAQDDEILFYGKKVPSFLMVLTKGMMARAVPLSLPKKKKHLRKRLWKESLAIIHFSSKRYTIGISS